MIQKNLDSSHKINQFYFLIIIVFWWLIFFYLGLLAYGLGQKYKTQTQSQLQYLSSRVIENVCTHWDSAKYPKSILAIFVSNFSCSEWFNLNVFYCQVCWECVGWVCMGFQASTSRLFFKNVKLLILWRVFWLSLIQRSLLRPSLIHSLNISKYFGRECHFDFNFWE